MSDGHFTSVSLAVALAVATAACGSGGASQGGGGTTGGTGGSGASGGGAPATIPVLGNGAHSPDAVEITAIATGADGLATPRDLAFNHDAPNELWVLNRLGPSVTILFNAGDSGQAAAQRSGLGGTHFMVEPAALAFGAPGYLATAQETDETTQPNTPASFMGPTLWPSDSGFFNGGHASHLDMMHNSPNAAGIAWDSGNAYWVFDGYHKAVSRYDFGADHGPGGEDHGDGSVARYIEGAVGYLADVPSHMELDHATGLLYIADGANGRIAVLDTQTGTKGGNLTPNYDGGEQFQVLDASTWTLIGPEAGLQQPSGLALHQGHIFVSDHATSRIFAFTLDGRTADYLDTGVAPGSLMGMAFDSRGRLFVVNAKADQVIMIAPKAAPTAG